MKKIVLTRLEVYDLVWNEPLSSITRIYTITYPELRKTLAELNIPIPENGHWSKLRFGKQLEVKPLPEKYSGKNEIELSLKEPHDPPLLSKYHKMLKGDDKDINIELFKVPERLLKPDHLITNTKNYFDAVRQHDWRSNDRYPERKDVLDIDVTQSTQSRALRIMDTVLKILKYKGHEVIFKYGKTHAVIYGQEIEIKLREKYRVIDEPREKYQSRSLEPTGILSFIIEYGHYHQKTINDGQELLETKIETIIIKLEGLGELRRKEHLEHEEWRRKYEEKQRIERELKEKKDKELTDFKVIFQRAFRLHQAEIIRNYLALIEKKAKDEGNQDEGLVQWIKWAKEKVDWYDPLINKVDPIFNDHDKANIFGDFLKDWV
jgi:hypothetical protein